MLQRGLKSWTDTAAERGIRNATGAAPDRQTDDNFYADLKALSTTMLGVQLSAEAGVRIRAPLDPRPHPRVPGFHGFRLDPAALGNAAVVERRRLLGADRGNPLPPAGRAFLLPLYQQGKLAGNHALFRSQSDRFADPLNRSEDVGDAGSRRIRPERAEPETDFLFNHAAHPQADLPGLAVRRTDAATLLSPNQRQSSGRIPDAADRSVLRDRYLHTP